MPVLECSRCNELYYSAHDSTELSCDACGSTSWRLFQDEVSFERVANLPRKLGPRDHAAIVYDDPAAAAEYCAGFLRDGLAAGERLLIVLPAALRTEIDKLVPPEELAEAMIREPHELYGQFSPDEAVGRFASLARESEQTMRILSGPDQAVDPDRWQRYERLAHELTIELDVITLCVYDRTLLPERYDALALVTHPLVSLGGDTLKRNGRFAYEAA